MSKAVHASITPPASAGRTPATNRRALFAAPALLGLAALPTVATVAPTMPDAALLDLGQRFEAAWTAERAAWDALAEDDESSPAYDRACVLSGKVGTLADEIERTRATSLPGLLVKARALRWNRGTGENPTVDMFDLRPLLRHWEPSDEQKLIVSILTDLHALTGGAA